MFTENDKTAGSVQYFTNNKLTWRKGVLENRYGLRIAATISWGLDPSIQT